MPNKVFIYTALFLSIIPTKVLSNEQISKKYDAYFNDNFKHWKMETWRFFQPSIKNLSDYQNDAKNWDNRKFWVTRAKDNHDFFCGMMKIGSEKKDKYGANSKRVYKEECLDKSYFNSQLKIKVATSKIDSCINFRKVDFFKVDKLLSPSLKSEIFSDCAKLYKTYSNDRKQFFSRLNPFYKMFYIHGLSVREIQNEVDNFHEKNKDCFISTNYNYVDVIKKGVIPSEYNKCMGWKWN